MNAGENGQKKTDGRKEPWLRRIPVLGQTLAVYQSYSRRNGPLLSAGIAYYGVFALAPLMLLTLQISGLLVGQSTAQQQLTDALEAYLGPRLAETLSGVITNLQGSGSTVATVVGVALLLYAATRLFLRLQASINVMWGLNQRWTQPSRWRFLSRLVTFCMILVPALLLVASLFLSAGISWLEDILGTSGVLLAVAQALIPFLVGWVALVAIFTILPDVHVSWRDCWPGALFTAVLCALGARVFGLYLSWSTSQKYAGAIGALIALIVWVDFMAIIALLGTRLNSLLYEWRGKTLKPYSFAVVAPRTTPGHSDEADPPSHDGRTTVDESSPTRPVPPAATAADGRRDD